MNGICYQYNLPNPLLLLKNPPSQKRVQDTSEAECSWLLADKTSKWCSSAWKSVTCPFQTCLHFTPKNHTYFGQHAVGTTMSWTKPASRQNIYRAGLEQKTSWQYFQTQTQNLSVASLDRNCWWPLPSFNFCQALQDRHQINLFFIFLIAWSFYNARNTPLFKKI